MIWLESERYRNATLEIAKSICLTPLAEKPAQGSDTPYLPRWLDEP